MMTIEFDNQRLQVPSGWNDITLGDYEKWHLKKPQTKSDYVRYVADVCGLDADVLLNAPTQLFTVITEAIGFVFDTEFEPKCVAEIDGRKYFVSLSDKLTLGEWVDVEAVMEGDDQNKLSELLAILCRPAGEDYNSDLTAERKELFMAQSCEKLLPLVSFFLFKKRRSDEILNHFSTVRDQAARFLEDTKAFAANGDGIKRLPIWQRIRYGYLIRSLEKQLSKCSDFSSIG